jgi:4-amino-4-deoxy-L-arabinose transferase-like glycosyltransferase
VDARLGRHQLALLGAVALGIRLLYILIIARAPIGVGGDASFYHSAANQLANGHFFYREIFSHAYPTALHPPLFSIVLTPVALLGGVHVLAQRVVGCVIGSISVVLIALLAARLGGRRAGVLAGSLAAVYPPLVTADGSLMSEPLYVLIVVLAMLLAISRPSTTQRAASIGAVIGLGVLTRTEAVLLLVLLAWPASWAPLAGRVRRILAATLACALVLAPWVIRNEVVFHRVELATNYDTVIAGANCRQTYYGHDIGWWSLDCLARSRTRHQLLIGDASTSGGIDYAGDHAGRAVLVAAVRTLRTFSLYQPTRIGNEEPRRQWLDVVGLVFYYPLLVAAAWGLTRLRERRWLLLAPVISALIVSATGWGNGRFRVAADASLIVLAAVALGRERPAFSRPAAAIQRDRQPVAAE